MKDNIEIKFCTNEEIEILINEFQTERLVFIDDGIDEVIGRFRDLPNIIVDLNRKFGSKDLNICRRIAYKLFKSEDFPSKKIGKNHQISLIAYLMWKVKKS